MRFFSLILLCVFPLIANSEVVSLWCEGSASGTGFSTGKSAIVRTNTSVDFDELTGYLSLSNFRDLAKLPITPFKEVVIGESKIHWKTPLLEPFANGVFFGSIDRKTGEMNTGYFGVVDIHVYSVEANLICEKKTSNRF